ncbi:LamG-like jellyroll fold domain-containing protein [Cesiribacter sp. SM1]|uniref:LamG-like jellyroll fold domain-containing protein n=1 Tax=Cesiribacter sp. SM1 TaxID=2861196 RepID=UPI001CD7F6EB|nr:LamG-like jellyroll fold domain-containing protein [Cesiribacter sp. SM1]
MKIFRNIMLITFALTLFGSCDDDGYIDPITEVAPGPDEAAPTVDIVYPSEGTQIRVPEDVTPVEISFEVEDDIEVQTITLTLDGTQIASFSEFLDYRRVIDSYVYENLTNGEHTLTVTATDVSGKSTSESVTFEKIEPYTPVYEGEVFYLPFDGSYMELVNVTNPTVVGSPGFTEEGVAGAAYDGAEGAYLTFSTDMLDLGNEFSASFWMNVNGTPDRAGILVIGPPDENNPDAMNNRTAGFRFFREGSPTNQIFKLNVGTGSSDSWFDGGAAASVVPNTGEWVHMAFTISETEAKVYINGELVSSGTLNGVSWEGTNVISIMSGAPRFTEWGHLSDQSQMDELRIFNTALTQEQIQQIIADES